jgi:hypothetical protein
MIDIVVWWRSLSRTVKVIGWGGIVCAAIVSFAQAAPYIEPYFYAHRGYVRAYDANQIKPIKEILTRIQLAQNRDRRQQLLDEAAKREIELQSEQAKQLPQYRALVQDRVDRVKSELKGLDDEDKSLFKQPLSK